MTKKHFSLLAFAACATLAVTAFGCGGARVGALKAHTGKYLSYVMHKEGIEKKASQTSETPVKFVIVENDFTHDVGCTFQAVEAV